MVFNMVLIRRGKRDHLLLGDGHPAWIAPKCEKCLRCLHYCPQFAIQHGPSTKKHGQYHHK